jgi:hypothetical protein
MSRPSRPLRTSGRFAHRPSDPDDGFRGSRSPINPVVAISLVVVVAGVGVLVWLLAGNGRPLQPAVAQSAPTNGSGVSQTPSNSNASALIGNHAPRAEMRIRIDPTRPYDAEYSGEFSDDMDASDEGKLTYAWDFGDGTTGTEGHGHHLYADAGTFTLSLTVTDPAGATNTIKQVVHVAQPATSCIGRPLADELAGLSVTKVTGSFHDFGDLKSLWAKGTKSVAEQVSLDVRPRDTWYALRFHGFINFPKDGTYTVFLGSDDGSRFVIGDETLILMDRHQGLTEQPVTFIAKAGLVPVRIDYYQGDGGQDLVFDWLGPGIPRQRVPASVFYHSAAE